MSKRSGIGRSLYIRYWGNPKVQPKFSDLKIQRGLDIPKKWKGEK